MSEVTISRSEYSRLKELSTLGVKVNNELTAKLQQANKDKAELVEALNDAAIYIRTGGTLADDYEQAGKSESIAAKHKED